MEGQSQGRYSTLEIRTRAIEAVGRGLAVGEIANAYGIDRTTLFRWLTRFGEHGQVGLQRKEGSGRPRLLDILDKNALWQIVLKPATSFGYETDLWTVGRLHRVIEEKYQTKISQDTIWRRLRDAGLTYQKPERQYFEMDVVMDQAPPHTSKKTMTFIAEQPRLHVFHLPKYSPDWNPDEKVWNHLKHQELKGHQAKTKAELKEMAHKKLKTMSNNPSLLRGIFFRCCVADFFK